MFARVIVDVAVKETDRLFDYSIPEQLRSIVHIGSRVIVPFGPRKLLGYVIELVDTIEQHRFKIKNIERVCDLEPPLTEELVALSAWMSHAYFCRRITAIQSMLPAALKANYKKKIMLGDLENSSERSLVEDPISQEMISYIEDKGSVDSEILLQQFSHYIPTIQQMLRDGMILETQHVSDQLRMKKVMVVFPVQNTLVQLSHAPRQQDVLTYLAAHPEPIPLQELVKNLGISASTIKSLAEKQMLEIKSIEVKRDPYAGREFKRTQPLPLMEEQADVFHSIKEVLKSDTYQTFLLHGVTGSGKTEVYLQSIQYCIEQGKESIVLVPEISLTPQMVERFKGRFGDQVAVLHSRLSKGERFDEWRRIKEKKVKVAIGARSAVFAPFTRLGLIIIDEEHESSYKQEESPKYEAKEVAKQRAKIYQAAVILGSATPSLEDYFSSRSSQGELQYLQLSRRVGNRPLPEVEVIDLREELKDGNRSMFSRKLTEEIQGCLDRKEQIVLLLNRRGYSTFVMCRSCGYTETCPHCDIALTYHRHSKTVRCHYCGYGQRENQSCPECSSEHIRFFGTGTQKVEEELSKIFPGIRTIRMDVDTTSEKGSHEKWLTQFEKHQADVLLGTQMVAKGLDFPKVTLVGVIAADTVLHLPDFRAAEKTFQLLTQVAGRAGRHELKGKVVVQTYNPEHYSVHYASSHDYKAFAERELLLRKQHPYPPFCRIILITLSHEHIPLILRAGEKLVQSVKEAWKTNHSQEVLDITGPVASPMAKLKDRYRFQCMIKYRRGQPVLELLRQVITQFDEVSKQQGLMISIDVNPQMMM